MISRTETLLIVDDDCTNRDLMSRRLSRRGFCIGQSENGADALNWVASHRVDLVLLDVEMPGITGIEVLRELRSSYAPTQLPVIMTTGRTDSEDIVKALQMGANDYVTKPIDFAVLLARIQTQLSLKRAEEALRKSEERYALAARGANDGLWDWDLISNTAYFSPRWKAMLGWREDEISDDPNEWFSKIHPEDVERVRADIKAHLEELTPHYQDEYRILHKDGNYLWMLGRGLAVWHGNGKAHRLAGSQTDITRGKVADALTGLPNRVLFMDRLERSFERAARRRGDTFAVIYLDLDSFKLINDSLGRLVGDRLLVEIACRLENIVRSTDTVSRLGGTQTLARLGGDEFTILLEDIDNVRDAVCVAERITKTLEAPFCLNGQEIFSNASMGIALYNPGCNSPEDILHDADTAMHRAKKLGKGRYEIFDTDMRASALDRLQLETELRRGIERKEFAVYYQPLVSLDTGYVTGFEALARWKHPTRGLVLPAEFIPVAEETGLIAPLGQSILETACCQMRKWQTCCEDGTELMIAVNLSARHFQNPELLEHCRTILARSGLPPQSLHIEVTESTVMPDPESAADLMSRLKSLGLKLALDDFGTGYSSLSYLHRFPLDTLKIDRSFVAHMSRDTEQLEIVRTIVNLGHNLGLRVIAEGVETLEQVDLLRQMGCDLGQGYLFSRPIDSEKTTALLAAKPRW